MQNRKLRKSRRPALLSTVQNRKIREYIARPAPPTGAPTGEVPEFASRGALFCPGCLRKVETQGTLLLIKNRGKARWVLAHNAHVAITGENSEVIQDAGEYGLTEMDSDFPRIDSEGNLVTVELRKVEKEIDT